MTRHVRGILFVEYVRLIRAHKEVPWDQSLLEEDLPFLSQNIYLSQWYPMATYERMGLAILKEIAGGDLERIRSWGRDTADAVRAMQPELIASGDPRETFMRFHVLRKTLFDYPAFRTEVLRDGCVTIIVDYGVSDAVNEAASSQSIGFIERLLEIAGATGIQVTLESRHWAGDPETVIQAKWEPRLGKIVASSTDLTSESDSAAVIDRPIV